MDQQDFPNAMPSMPDSQAARADDAGSAVDIRALIPQSSDSEAITATVAAYKSVLHELGLTGRLDPIAEIFARKIIDMAATGERDPARIQTPVISGLGLGG
jgi:hypothetical protein